MSDFKRGSKGQVVVRIQTRLKELGVYQGPLDGDFGGGTEGAVRKFQQTKEMTADGIVNPATWDALFPGEPVPVSPLLKEPLAFRCLALTATFETDKLPPDCFAGLSGDFDGQGISFGVLQWNVGQGSLQPLLAELDSSHPSVVEDVFQQNTGQFRAILASDRDEQLAGARLIQDPKHNLFEPWRGMFKTLGRRPEFQAIQTKHADKTFQNALALCHSFGVRSERAAALMFDILVQNGSINKLVTAQIQQDFKEIHASTPDEAEVARLRIIANRRSAAANPKWVDDVRSRKLTIANGTGTVHGNFYDLEGQFGISLRPF